MLQSLLQLKLSTSSILLPIEMRCDESWIKKLYHSMVLGDCLVVLGPKAFTSHIGLKVRLQSPFITKRNPRQKPTE